MQISSLKDTGIGLWQLSTKRNKSKKMWYVRNIHYTKNWIYSKLLGANMLQKRANKEEIKSKDGKCRICLRVYMGL